MPNNDTDYFLRPEAGPVPYRKLQRRAKDALKRIVQALNAAVGSAEAAADSEDVGRVPSYAIDKHRSSRLFFVSGEPGSGKSTLYVTLRAMLSKEKRYSEYSEGYDGEDLKKLKDNVRWLEPIDLEVVGDKEENLLAAVLVRLIRALDESKSGFSKDCGEAIKKLDELAADIGMAWDSNLRARASALDPDSYSMEVMRAQRARLGVNERLREALDKLAKHNCCGCDTSTLFVLPVDDLYLKPDASLQLLRLLRMISVPRLFFLVMGDITTVEALFTEKALADWTEVAGAEVFQTLPDRLSDALARARELRARFLRKLLPPKQRAEIQPMDWDEAMNFRPERFNGKAEALGTWLAEVKLDKPWTPDNKDESLETQTTYRSNLFDFLTCRPLDHSLPSEEESVVKEVEKLIGEKKKSREAYTGIQLLDVTPREIMDLWSALQEVIRKKEEKSELEGSDYKIPLLSLVLEFVRLSIDEQNFLGEKQQSAILNGVLPTRRYYTPDTYLEMDRLHLEPESSGWKEVFPEKVWVRKHSPWKLTPTASSKEKDIDLSSESKTQENSSEFNKLPPRQTAWIVLLHDLAWMWRRGSLKENLVESLQQKLKEWSKSNKTKLNPKGKSTLTSDTTSASLVKDTEFEQNYLFLGCQGLPLGGSQDAAPKVKPPDDFPGWAITHNGLVFKPLELPAFKTFRDLDCFLRVWNRGLEVLFPNLEGEEQPDISEPRADLLINILWAFAGWTVFENQYHRFTSQDDKWFKEAGLRANLEPEPAPQTAQNTEAKREEWQEELSKFKKNARIEKCLERLSDLEREERSKVESETRSTSAQTESNFDRWAGELLKEVCPDRSNDVINQPTAEPTHPIENDAHSGEEPTDPTNILHSAREREEDKI
jgi:hypothetical protein